MMTLIVALALTAAYLWIGLAVIAPRVVTRYIESQQREFAKYVNDQADLDRWRNDGAVFGIMSGFIWPVVLVGWKLTALVKNAAPLTRQELAQQVTDRDARIAELEKQLGVGKL